MSAEGSAARGVVFRPKQSRFLTIPQSPLCYWLRERFVTLSSGVRLDKTVLLAEPSTTGDNSRFMRAYWEVRELHRWRWVSRGGGYGKWDGFNVWLVDWEHSGARIKERSGSFIRNEELMFREGLTYTESARGSLGSRILPQGETFGKSGPGLFPKGGDNLAIAAVLNCRVVSYFLRVVARTFMFSLGSLANVPFPARLPGELSDFGQQCTVLKKASLTNELTEREFSPRGVTGTSLLGWSMGSRASVDALDAFRPALEGFSERAVFDSYSLDEDDEAAVLEETGTPAGWHPLVGGYDAIPPLPDNAKIDPELLSPLKDHPRVKPTGNDLADLKRRLRALYEAGRGASPQGDDEAEPADNEDEESEEVAVSGARIPIPSETFIEELSQKREIHPISVYWLLRELREQDGVVCVPELRRFVSDHFTAMVLRMLGHRWPKQVEAGEAIPEWAEPSGIIPVTEGAGAENLISRMRKRIAADFGADRVAAIEREFEEIMDVALETWLGRDFYRNHISQFRKRPIAWQLQSTPEASVGPRNRRGQPGRRKSAASRTPIFSCLLYYRSLDEQLLGTIRTQYAHPMRLRMETELRELERIDTIARKPEQEERRADLSVRIEELKDFEAKLESVERDGFGSEALTRIASKEPLDKWTSRDGTKEHRASEMHFWRRKSTTILTSTMACG